EPAAYPEQEVPEVPDVVLHLPERSVRGDAPALHSGVGVALRHDGDDIVVDDHALHAMRDEDRWILRVLERDDVAEPDVERRDLPLNDHVARVDRRLHAAGEDRQIAETEEVR